MKAFLAESGLPAAVSAARMCVKPRVRLHVRVAQGFLARARGLIGRPMPAPQCGLLLPGVSAVHGFGMRYPVDLVFLDEKGIIVRCACLAPAGFAGCSRAHDVLEMRAGEIGRLGLQPDMRPLLVRVDDIFGDESRLPVHSPPLSAGDSGQGPNARLVVFILGAFLVGAMTHGWSYGAPPNAAQPNAAETAAGLGPLSLARPISAQTLQRLEDEAESLYRDDRRHAELIRLYESLAELATDRSPHAWLRIGNIHQRSGAVGEAIDAYRRAFAGTTAAQGAMATSAERKALLNLTGLALEQARQSLARLASLPAAVAGAGAQVDEPALSAHGMAAAAGSAFDRQLQSLERQLARQQEHQAELFAADGAASTRQPPHVVERYTASGRRNAVKAARGSLHVNPADQLPAGPVAKPRSRPPAEQLPSVEYLYGDPNRPRQALDTGEASAGGGGGAGQSMTPKRPPKAAGARGEGAAGGNFGRRSVEPR
jgi:uncharacterized membrane protein (UPF0127 family)